MKAVKKVVKRSELDDGTHDEVCEYEISVVNISHMICTLQERTRGRFEISFGNGTTNKYKRLNTLEELNHAAIKN